MARPKGSSNKPKKVEPAMAPEQEAPQTAETAASPEPNMVPQPKAPDTTTIEVETAGDYQLFDLMTNDVYAHDKPTKCDPNNPFVKRELAKGRLKVVK